MTITPGTSEAELDIALACINGGRGMFTGRDMRPLITEIHRLRAVIEGTLAHKAQWADDLTIKEQLAHLYNGDKDWRPK